MAQTAFQTQYRQEFIAGFEQMQSLLRDATTTEAVVKGNTATFLVADSGGATAVTRGVNGLIPSRPDNLTQNSATLVEWHDKPIKTGFNVFASQGNQRQIMQATTMGVINRKIDQDILTELSTATVTAGAATTMSLALATKVQAILGLAKVPWDNQIFAVISPSANAYLQTVAAFTSSDFVDGRPMQNPNSWADKPKMRSWLGVNWIVHPSLPGVGTASESCFMFHRSAIGHAANVGEMMSAVGYDEQDDYSYARTSIYMGAKLLQNSGVVKFLHDGSAHVGS
jgi:Phage capsid protein